MIELPLLRSDTLAALLDTHRAGGAAATLLSVVLDDPAEYGRVVREPDGSVRAIVENKDAGAQEKRIHEINVGIYAFAHARNHEPRRRRKLLLHRREIDRLIGKIREKGFTLVPLSLYEKQGYVKVELALVHGKQQHDRREDVKKREAQREIDRAMSSRRR